MDIKEEIIWVKEFIFLFLTSMKNVSVLLGFCILLSSCGAYKPVKSNKGDSTYHRKEVQRNLKSELGNKKKNSLVSKIIRNAERYRGVPYRLGGMSSSGFDCSGFVVKVFNENNLDIARRSQDQAKEGKQIEIRKVEIGDLLFFATSGGSRVTHVGIVHTIENSGEIRFIHASTTKGVIISSLNENYWNKAFLFARRVLR